MRDVPRILCLVDFSEVSERALDYALELARSLDGELHVLHCYEAPVYPMPAGAVVSKEELSAQARAEAQRALEALRSRHPGEMIEHLEEGLPHRLLGPLVEALGVDLVVMGTHGRTGLGRLLLGSVAARVVRTSPVPVITVPPAR